MGQARPGKLRAGADAFAWTVKAEQARWKSVIDVNNIRAE
jgi:hypothetical protein